MATRAELLEKAKAAKAAKAAGTVGAFVAESKQKKAAAPKAPAAVAPLPPAATTDTSSKPATFGGLAGLRRSSSMEDEDDDRDLDGAVDEVPEDQSGRMSLKPAAPLVAGAPAQDQEAARPSAPTPVAAPVAPAPATTQSKFNSLVAGARERRTSDGSAHSPTPRSNPVPEIQVPSGPDGEWAERSIPSGSHYTLAEWNEARAAGNFVVFEMRSGSQCALVRAPRAPVATQTSATQKVIVNGKVGTEAEVGLAIDPNSPDYMSPMIAILVEGCLLLGPKAKTTHPAAATSLYTVKMPDGKDWVYKVVRPAAHRDDPQTAWLFTARGSLPFIAPIPTDVQHQITGELPGSREIVAAPEAEIAATDFNEVTGEVAPTASLVDETQPAMTAEEEDALFQQQSEDIARERMSG